MTGMTFPALLQRFFTDRLCTQMEASRHTIGDTAIRSGFWSALPPHDQESRRRASASPILMPT